MKRRITGFAPWQTAKTLALCYFVMGLVFAIPIGLLMSFVPTVPGQNKPSPVFLFILPVLYAVAALIFVPLGCWIYNKVANITGGIELSVISEDDA
jgi:hypothetical protein